MPRRYVPLEAGPVGETSIHRKFVGILKDTHDSLGISTVIGPYGIGKTTAIRDFIDNHAEGRAISVKAPARRKNIGISELVLCKALEKKLQLLVGRQLGQAPHETHDAQRQRVVKLLIEYLAPEIGTRTSSWNEQVIRAADFPRFTLVLDEAQELSRLAFNALRFWSDEDDSAFFLPVSIVLFGNSELAEVTEKTDRLRGAVDSRLLYREVFDYADVSDDDMRIWLVCHGIERKSLQTQIIRFYKKMKLNRDGRRLRMKLAKVARALGPDYSDDSFMNLFMGIR